MYIHVYTRTHVPRTEGVMACDVSPVAMFFFLVVLMSKTGGFKQFIEIIN